MPTSLAFRACGGVPPYTWSIDGPATLNRTTGRSVKVSAVTAVDPSVSSHLAYITGATIITDKPGTACDTIQATMSILTGLNCAGAVVGPDDCLPSYAGASSTVRIAAYFDCFGGAAAGPTAYSTNCHFKDATGDGTLAATAQVRIQIPTFSIDHTFSPVTIPTGANQTISGGSGAMLDVRTPADIALGCGGCTEGVDITLTVTDAAGVSATYVINA